MPDLSFSLPELDKHASSLSELSSQVRSTVSSAQQQPNPMMYGVLMSPLLTGVMSMITGAAAQYLNGASGGIEQVSGQMKETSKAYRTLEDDNIDKAKAIIP